jgi:[protein-PII] uridylyltransferase
MTDHLEKVRAHARKALAPAHKDGAAPAEVVKYYRTFLRKEEMRIRMLHRGGGSAGGGVRIGELRAGLLDVVLENLLNLAREAAGVPKSAQPITLVATGGYGRGLLNPCSDVDLLFLVPGRSAKFLSPQADAIVQKMFYLLTDIRLKISPVTRSLEECITLANDDHETKTSLLEARFLAGDEALYQKLSSEFQRRCLKGQEAAYLERRREDLKARHAKQSNTVYLQEPNVKVGCGGLRDYQNLLWVSLVKSGARSMADLAKQKLLSPAAYRELERGYDFLHRVRNELHYLERRPQDQLTLRLQGRVATNLKYPQPRVLTRIEAFMRDYYHHTRNIFQHTQSLMERFQLEAEDKPAGPLSFLARRKPKIERFDGFFSKGGLIYPDHDRIFKEDEDRLMRLFQHTQVRHLELSPQIRQLFKSAYPALGKTFRYRKTNRETFEAILSRKGDVARVLRQMHRVGFLGRYLPEFGALTDLVQHEFFHRYSADEHTLRVVEFLDHLLDTRLETPLEIMLRDMFQEVEDPFVLYLAILLHDSGRATDADQHEYASAMLASRVCNRLKVGLDRRRLLLFLVDHHLSLFRTATQQNIEDASIIEDFAAIVREKAWLDALLVMTYADSKGTSETSWSGFKQSLMLQLYRSTATYFADRPGFEAQARQAERAEFRTELAEKLGAGWVEEIEAQFDGMPERYFAFRSAHRVASHLRLFREFFKAEQFNETGEPILPVYRWRTIPERVCSELTLVTRDRSLLLARVAGCLARCGLNILSADFFLRKDGVVFDIFRVCTTRLEPVTDERVLRRFERLIGEVFSTEEPDWSALRPPEDPEDANDAEFRQLKAEFPTRVYLSNELNPRYTVVEIDAVDRLGLLSDFFRVIGGLGLEIAHARINTDKGGAQDSFYLTDAQGDKITDRDALRALREGLGRAAVDAP